MLLMLFSQIMVLYTFVAVLGFLVVLGFVFTISMQCSLQRQFSYQTIINKHRHFVNSFFGRFKFIFLWIQGIPRR